MADVEEGNNPRPADDVARQTLKQLRGRLWLVAPIHFDEPPAVLEFEVMGKREIWRRGAVCGGAAKESTLYELDRSAR